MEKFQTISCDVGCTVGTLSNVSNDVLISDAPVLYVLEIF